LAGYVNLFVKFSVLSVLQVRSHCGGITRLAENEATWSQSMSTLFQTKPNWHLLQSEPSHLPELFFETKPWKEIFWQ